MACKVVSPMLRCALLSVLSLLPVATLAAPSVTDQVLACSSETSMGKRLSCYDEVVQGLQGSTSAISPPPTAASEPKPGTPTEIKDGDMFGRWRAEVTIDPMTDVKTIGFRDTALPGQSDSADEARIALLCSGKKINFVWLSRAYLGKADNPLNNVSYRVDAERPHFARWSTFKNIAASDDVAQMVQAMAGGKRFVFSVDGYDFESHRAVFDLDGVTDVLAHLSACWPPAPLPAPVTATPGTAQPLTDAAPGRTAPTQTHPVQHKSRK